MRSLKETLLTALASTVFLFCLAVPAQGTPLNAWELRCVQDDEDGTKLCAVELHAQEHGRDFIFYFARGRRGPVPFVAATTVVSPPFFEMEVAVDGEAPLQADFCEKDVCYYAEKKSRRLIRLFKKGRAAHITIRDPSAKKLFDSVITLAGFSAAYKRYR